MGHFTRSPALNIFAIVLRLEGQPRFAVAEKSLGTGFRIDLLCRLVAVDVEGWWSRARPSTLESDQFVTTVLHAAKRGNVKASTLI